MITVAIANIIETFWTMDKISKTIKELGAVIFKIVISIPLNK